MLTLLCRAWERTCIPQLCYPTQNVSGTASMAAQVSEEQQKKAEEFKNEANRLFGENHFPESHALYTKAIELNPNVAVYYANRAFAYTKMEQYGAAIEDATKAIQVDPTYAKAYYRRGSAFMLLGKHKEALNDFRHVAKAHPSNKEAKEKLQQCEKGAFRFHLAAFLNFLQSSKRFASPRRLAWK